MLDLFGAASFEALTLALDVGLIDALDREELALGEIAADSMPTRMGSGSCSTSSQPRATWSRAPAATGKRR